MYKGILVSFLMLALVACSSSSSDEKVKVYVDFLRERICSNLIQKDEFKGLSVKLNVKLDESTTIKQFKIIESSGSKSFDQAVEQAIYKSFPFEKLQELASSENHRIEDINIILAAQ
ncbi:TonB C-terminal domain-containing protein [Vibrio mimicus]